MALSLSKKLDGRIRVAACPTGPLGRLTPLDVVRLLKIVTTK